MADVFVSYKREDRHLVRPLVRALQERGFTVWWDSRIETGENWIACIKRALDSASCVVVVWTPQSVGEDRSYSSDMIAAEANEGWGRGVLLPVRMQNGPYAFPHNVQQAENLTNWQEDKEDPALARLARAICKHCGERSPPEPAELSAWLRAEDGNDAEAYRTFARDFPHSRFATEAEPRAAEVDHTVADIESAKAAASRITSQFSREVRKPAFTVGLRFGRITSDGSRGCTPDELFDLLGYGSKASIQAAPGGGKTVTLLQWAEAFCASDPQRVGVFIRLGELNCDSDLIDHIARLETTEQVSESAWRALARSGVLAVFCDGWNELSDTERQLVGSILNVHARTYASSGLVVGTRPLAPPPLRGEHLELFLERLTFMQIPEIVEARLGEDAPSALLELRESRQLTDLVRNPFFLGAFCQTRRAGATPTTRYGLIQGMINAGEQLPEHSGALRRALRNQHPKYLRALATDMLREQRAELSNDDSCRAINRASVALSEAALISERPDASIVLETLRDHHFLIEHTDGAPSFRFQHQLISEWYASDEVQDVAFRALSEEAARIELDREILNNTAWTEAALFAVERPELNNDGIRARSYLVLRAIGINPEFAADLIAVSPPEVWSEVAPIVRDFLQELQPAAMHRVVEFVLRCGKPDFSEILWAVLSEDRSSPARHAFHRGRLVNPRVLGPDWRQRCAALSLENRTDLLVMLASDCGLEGANMAVSAAIADNDPHLQSKVAEHLWFCGYSEELNELLSSASPETWEELVRGRNLDVFWEEPWRTSAISASRRVVSELEAGEHRIRHVLRLRSVGEESAIDVVAELLELDLDDRHRHSGLFSRVAEFEGERLSAALLERALEGQRLPSFSAEFMNGSASVDQARVLEACRRRSGYSQHWILSPLLSAESLADLFSELLQADAQFRATRGAEQNAAGDRYRWLKDVLLHADRNALAEMLLGLELSESSEIARASDVLMRASRDSARRTGRASMRAELREQITDRLADWSERLVSDPNCHRYELHSLAEAIAAFPSGRLLSPLRDLLSADLTRWRAQKDEFDAAIARGRQPDPASGARMSYTHRYGQNLLSIAKGHDVDVGNDVDTDGEIVVSDEMSDAVVGVLGEFLLDYEFGEDAARVIATLRPDPITEIGEPRRFVSLDARVARERREARATRGGEAIGSVAEHLLEVIDQLVVNGSPEALQHALKLSASAVRMGCGGRLSALTELVIRHGSVEVISRHMRLRLLYGHSVDGEAAERCLDQLDARREERQWEYAESWFKWNDLLVLMVFGDKPMDAARRLLTYELRGRDHDERPLVEALGLCGHQDSLEALKLIRGRCVEQRCINDWFSAVHAVGNADAGELLLTAVFELPEDRNWHGRYGVFAMIAELSERYPSLRGKILSIANDGPPENLRKIAGVVSQLRDEELLSDVLAIPGDRLLLLSRAIEDSLDSLCLDDHPIQEMSGGYSRTPIPIPTFRARLFARANSADSGSALCAHLLCRIEEIRDFYGAPATEARHPDITVGAPWPTAAKCAWDASSALLQRADSRMR